MDEFSLDGVLRSELSDKLTAHVARYIREPIVRAVPLLRIAVLGHVGRPGFYYSAADALVSDVVMLAGGPSPQADLGKMVVRRGPNVIWSSDDMSVALSDGLSLDRLHLRSGDAIEIGARRQFAWRTIVPVVTGVIALIVSISRL
jgi:polysaccharide export outer membrane protein